MVKVLIHDPFFLGIKSKPATKDDASVARDLIDTLNAHRETCVGMAANMIGKAVRIIVFIDGAKPSLMFNPEIIRLLVTSRCTAQDDQIQNNQGKISGR